MKDTNFLSETLAFYLYLLTTYQFTCRMGRAKAKPIIIDALRTSAHPMYKTDRW